MNGNYWWEAAVLRANSRLRQVLGDYGVEFLTHAVGAFQRILPHVEVSAWREVAWSNLESVWADSSRTEIRVTIPVGEHDLLGARALTTRVKRRRVAVASQVAGGTLDTREYDICKRIAGRIAEVVSGRPASIAGSTLRAVRDSFDEDVISQHVEHHHDLEMSVATLFADLHTLSEGTYENRAISFGCIIDPQHQSKLGQSQFPREFLKAKKYRALSDGYRTAYLVSSNGKVVDFLDLETSGRGRLTGHNIFPDWSEPLARNTRGKKYGIALSRQGDILVFDDGSLRFSHRHGRWQYWNHNHIVNLLCDRAKAQHVNQRIVNTVVGALYISALDVSFRRSGGLFVILHNRRNLKHIVRRGDAIGDRERQLSDRDFDRLLNGQRIQFLPSAVIMELAALDGAIVVSNDGVILAYGAVLSPRKKGQLKGTEGSRTKAAVGASNYGLALKISSDGDIDAFHEGRAFMKISGAG